MTDPLEPKKVKREERRLGAESTPVPPSNVCSSFYTHGAVTFTDQKCADRQGDEEQRYGHVQNQGEARARQGIDEVTQHSRVTLDRC